MAKYILNLFWLQKADLELNKIVRAIFEKNQFFEFQWLPQNGVKLTRMDICELIYKDFFLV